MLLPKHVQEQRLIYSNFLDAFVLMADSFIKQHGCLLTNSSIPHPFFNSVLACQLTGDVPEQVDAVMSEFGLRERCWWITPFTQPTELATLLLSKGFTIGEEFVGMIYGLKDFSPSPSHHIFIKEITHSEELEEWCHVLAIGFEFSSAIEQAMLQVFKRLFNNKSLVHYGAYMNNQIVGTGSLFTKNSVAGFYNLAVLPAYRHQKIASQLKIHRLQLAKKAGCTYAILQSSKQGLSLDKKIGFQERMKFIPYLWRPTVDSIQGDLSRLHSM